MREIKFRARTVVTGEWIYFDLRGLEQSTFKAQFIWETVGQYTGLHDKNGREIYEGDIVKHKTENSIYSDHSLCDDSIGVIRFADCGFKYQNIKDKYDFEFGDELINSDDYEVIGNIHENPELIK